VKDTEVKQDVKTLALIDSGWEAPSTDPLDRGRTFSVWRLIFGR
jgi:hypothetical protein